MNCPPRVGDADAKGASVVTTETLVSQRNPQRGYEVYEVKRRGYFLANNHTTSPSTRKRAFGTPLGEINFPFVATDAFIPRRPPTLGGESKQLVLISNLRYFI